MRWRVGVSRLMAPFGILRSWLAGMAEVVVCIYLSFRFCVSVLGFSFSFFLRHGCGMGKAGRELGSLLLVFASE